MTRIIPVTSDIVWLTRQSIVALSTKQPESSLAQLDTTYTLLYLLNDYERDVNSACESKSDLLPAPYHRLA